MSLREKLEQIEKDLADIEKDMEVLPRLEVAAAKWGDLPKRMSSLEDDLVV